MQTHNEYHNVYISRTINVKLFTNLINLYYLHNYDNEVIINLKEELEKGAHAYKIPSIFGKTVSWGKKEYVHNSPAFRISYPKHYKLVRPELNEVFRAKHPAGGLTLTVSIDAEAQNIPLKDIGEKLYLPELKKIDADAKISANIQAKLLDETPANEVQFDWVTADFWPMKTLVLSTYRDDRLIYAAVHSLADPGFLREYLYSLRFD
jgi:hypothetical protein